MNWNNLWIVVVKLSLKIMKQHKHKRKQEKRRLNLSALLFQKNENGRTRHIPKRNQNKLSKDTIRLSLMNHTHIIHPNHNRKADGVCWFHHLTQPKDFLFLLLLFFQLRTWQKITLFFEKRTHLRSYLTTLSFITQMDRRFLYFDFPNHFWTSF